MRDLTSERPNMRGSNSIRLASDTLKNETKAALAASSQTDISGARNRRSSAEAQTNSYLLLGALSEA